MKYLKDKIKAFQDRKAEIAKEVDSCQDIEKLKALNIEITDINQEMLEYQAELDKYEGQNKGFNPIATYSVQKGYSNNDDSDITYRKAFMEYVTKGVDIPQDIKKAAQTTTTGDIGAIIPKTVMNQIYQKLKNSGMIYQKIRKTSLKGGVSLPISTVFPVATWTAEGTTSETQKKTVGEITFSYYKLQCKVALTLEASVVSLDIFEQQIAIDISEAMIIAIEKAVLFGTGTGQPKGIFKEVSAPTVEITEADLSKYPTYAKIRAKIGTRYRGNAVWLMTQTDFDTHVVGMVDSNGQPIARVTVGLDGVPAERILGLPVVTVDDDYISSFDTATAGEYFGALVNLDYYAYNSNMQMGMRKYFDEDTDEYIMKATAMGDGKLITTDALVLLKKQ